jgi:hypothetical protein
MPRHRATEAAGGIWGRPAGSGAAREIAWTGLCGDGYGALVRRPSGATGKCSGLVRRGGTVLPPHAQRQGWS